METRILYEDKQILTVVKPAGIPTQTAGVLQKDVVSELKTYLAEEAAAGRAADDRAAYTKEPYLGVIHRLDQPVAGVLVFARTSFAAAALTKQLTENKMQKEYLAAVYAKTSDVSDGILTDYLLKDGRTNTSFVAAKETPHAKRAELSYRVIDSISLSRLRAAGLLRQADGLPGEGNVAFLKICLKTGRHHQIRVQLSHAGMPLLGDKKYGSGESIDVSKELQIRDVALCARALAFYHPKSKKRLEFVYDGSKTELFMKKIQEIPRPEN